MKKRPAKTGLFYLNTLFRNLESRFNVAVILKIHGYAVNVLINPAQIPERIILVNNRLGENFF